MKKDAIPFQELAIAKLREETYEALGSYQRTHTPQVVSYTAPTGAGKTIIIASLIENIYFGNEIYTEQPNAIFIWLSDSPELNEQSKQKIDLKADKIRLDQTVTVDEASFDMEYFEDGHIYFLNTQKIGSGKLLTKHSDSRQYTIWETIRNTVQEKSDRLYFIIDEAHRGMQGKEASKATSIMQKFIKGSEEDCISAMPLVIGITATWNRFNALVSGTISTLHRIQTTTDEVRASGLLKDRIVITYPDTVNNDMAVLQAASDEWKEKWDHWTKYCSEQHCEYVNPIFVIQVQNGNANIISETDLDDCLQKVEERTGMKFKIGEVVHTFGQTSSTIQINGLDVQYVEPSKIAEDGNIKVVFFKENLSTGWDCPRAETMMSFRHANDSTYIAQLLGRMVRTPKQMHIQVDDTLNDVHLYLPYFNADSVNDVVDALQNSEGGDIPTDIYGESFGENAFDTLTIKPTHPAVIIPQNKVRQKQEPQITGQISLLSMGNTEKKQILEISVQNNEKIKIDINKSEESNLLSKTVEQSNSLQSEQQEELFRGELVNESNPEDINNIDREEVMKAINDAGLLTYDVQKVLSNHNNYLNSLYSLARLLTHSGIEPSATDTVINEIVEMIRKYVDSLKQNGDYDQMAEKVMQFKLNTRTFDVFGETIDNNSIHNLLSSADTDINRQLRVAEAKLGREGVSNRYVRKYSDSDNITEYKIDVILFVANDDCLSNLNAYAKNCFHKMNDYYRKKTISLSDKFKNQYNKIVSDGDIVSKHNYVLPEKIQLKHIKEGKDYTNHLFVDDSGKARIKLNGWEEGVLEEEIAQPDFVCWLRNPVKKSWSLCVPYKMGGIDKPAYPDFIIIRKDKTSGYVIDLLEPHDPTRIDNIGKAKGFAEYARQNPGVGRIELIRKSKSGKFKRLDMSKSLIRDKVSNVMTDNELDHLFDTDGIFVNE